MNTLTALKKDDWSIKNETGSYLLRVFSSFVSQGKRDEKDHHHLEIELSYIKKGKGVFLVGNEKVSFESGDVFVFNVNDRHCITEISEETEILKIWFSPQYVWTFSFLTNRHINVFSENNLLLKPKITSEKLKQTVVSHLESMQEELREKKKGFENKITLLWLDILVEIEREIGEKGDSFSTAEKHSQDFMRLESVMSYIEENFCNDLTLDELASVANLSRTYFCSYFKLCNNVTVWEYITLKRIHYAVRLLRSTDRTILDIALSCGYNNCTNFNRAVKKVTGKAPSYFRKKVEG